MTDTAGLWNAVGKLVEPTHVRLDRGDTSDYTDLLNYLAADPAVMVCHVPTYRSMAAKHHASVVAHVTVPSLWDQSTWALFGGEVSAEGGGKPARERSPADLQLLETRAQIAEAVRDKATKLGEKPTSAPFRARDELRHLASLIIANDPDSLDLWEYRIAQWGRVLENYLNIREHEAKPVRLRGAACPVCRTRRVIVEQDGERVEQPAIVIDFHQGYVRAGVCTACGHSWFRGEQLEELAELLAEERGA